MVQNLDGRLGLALVFTAALAAFGLQSLGWALVSGRDWQDYLIYWHELREADPLFPALMVTRTPLAPLFFGPLFELGGAALAELGAGLLFALTATAWTATARYFGRNAAIAMAALLVLLPTFGLFYHQLGSDPVFASALALTALLTLRAAERPTAARFVLLGAGVAALVLARPAGLPFVLLAVLPLGIKGSGQRRLAWAGACLGTTAALLGAWAAHNATRFDDFTVARGGLAGIPFYRALVVDGIVEPENGPATRDLVAALDSELLAEEPYRSWGFDTGELLASRSTWVFDDVVRVADRRWGWRDDYRRLLDVGVEAVRSHPAAYGSGVAETFAGFVLAPYFGPSPVSGWVGDPEPLDGPTDAVLGGGRRLPGRVQHLGSVYAIALVNNWALAPSSRFTIAGGLEPRPGVIFSPLEKRSLRWRDLEDARRHERVRTAVIEALRDLSNDSRLEPVHSVLRTASVLMPPIAFWALVGLAAWLRWHKRGLWPAGLLALAALAVMVETALGFPRTGSYALPFLPAFMFFALAALAGSRQESPDKMSRLSS